MGRFFVTDVSFCWIQRLYIYCSLCRPCRVGSWCSSLNLTIVGNTRDRFQNFRGSTQNLTLVRWVYSASALNLRAAGYKCAVSRKNAFQTGRSFLISRMYNEADCSDLKERHNTGISNASPISHHNSIAICIDCENLD